MSKTSFASGQDRPCENRHLNPLLHTRRKDPLSINHVGLSHEVTRILAGPKGEVCCIAALAGGSEVALCTDAGALYVYKAGSEHQPMCVLVEEKAACVDWSIDGTLLGVGTQLGSIILFGSDSLTVLWRVKHFSRDPITIVRFSPEGPMLGATCAGMRVWLLHGGSESGKLRAHGVAACQEFLAVSDYDSNDFGCDSCALDCDHYDFSCDSCAFYCDHYDFGCESCACDCDHYDFGRENHFFHCDGDFLSRDGHQESLFLMRWSLFLR